MLQYYFKVTISGTGKSPDDAWADAIEQFSMEPGCTPEGNEYTVEVIDED